VAGVAKIWFITGTTSGFGGEWARAALERGDRVAATARRLDRLRPLVDEFGDAVLPVALDVTDRGAAFAAVQEAATHFGRLDVVVNNAGYGHHAMVEELSEDDVRRSLETNFFGALWVTQAALPILRAQGSGRILQVTSEGGVTTFPQFGAYHAAKWALEGLSQTLAAEVASFGVRVTMVEPGPYATDFGGGGLRTSDPDPAYDGVRAGLGTDFEPGTPSATRAAILRLVDSDDPPLRLHLGRGIPGIEQEYAQRVATWRSWQDVSEAAFGGRQELTGRLTGRA
jgi:NAD(P)-dependent dehydrogenase (short-subunit alcohol dehydrogenase family)